MKHRINNIIKGRKKHRETAGVKGSFFKTLLVVCMIISIVLSTPVGIGKANTVPTGTSVTVAIDYLQEIATVSAGPSGSTRFYISTDGKKTWDLIDASRLVDLSSVLSNKALTVYFKGNKDTYELPIALQTEEPKDLTVGYKVVDGVGRIEFISTKNLPVEYKKGANGAWKTATSPIMYTSVYELKGATFYFRTAATAERRAGKTISVKVPKRPTAPNAKVDGSKLILSGLKANQTWYRTDNVDAWRPFVPVSKENYIDLKSVLGVSPTGSILGGTIELYTPGTSKKVSSNVRVITIPPQAAAPQAVTVTGTTITILDTNLKTNYEYTVVMKGSVLDLNKAKWSQVTAKKPVVVKNVSINDKIYVRLKSTTDSKTKQVSLASLPREFTVTSITLIQK